MKHWMNELCREPAPGGDARPRPAGGSVSGQQQALHCTTRYLEQAQQKGLRRDPGGEQGGAPTPSLGNDSHPHPGRRSGSPTRVRQRALTPPASHTDPRVPGPAPGHLSPETAAATWPSLPLLPTAGRGGRRPTSGSLLASHAGVPARGGAGVLPTGLCPPNQLDCTLFRDRSNTVPPATPSSPPGEGVRATGSAPSGMPHHILVQ